MNNGRPLTFIEFFAGIGLVRMGLEMAGWSALYANDIDPKKAAMYASHYGRREFVLGDINALDPATIPAATLATASFPCIDLSLAGNRAGLAGAHSGAFWGFARILASMETRPALVMVENVVGLLTANHGCDFRRLIAALNELGYRCDAFVLDAAHFVPQSRPRVFVVGAMGDLMPRSPAPPDRGNDLCPSVLRQLRTAHADLNWGALDLPPVPECRRTLADVVEVLPPDSDQWWPEERVRKTLQQMSPKHRQIAEAMMCGGYITYGAVYRRVRNGITRAELRVDGLAGCLRTPRGGSSRQILYAAGAGWRGFRYMTPREYARLQGVDDSYIIDAPVVQALFGFGDAVCVPAIAWIGRHCLAPLAARM